MFQVGCSNIYYQTNGNRTSLNVSRKEGLPLYFQAEFCVIYKPEVSYAGLEPEFVCSALVNQVLEDLFM